MKSFQPFLAFLLIPLRYSGFSICIFYRYTCSATFSSKEDLPVKLSTSFNKVSSIQSVNNNKFTEAVKLTEQFVIKQEFIHDYSELDMSLNLSDPSKELLLF